VPLAFCARLVTPTGRPAGIVATAGWLVIATGEAVSPAGMVAATGWPVIMPSELVWVSSVVWGTLYEMVVVTVVLPLAETSVSTWDCQSVSKPRSSNLGRVDSQPRSGRLRQLLP